MKKILSVILAAALIVSASAAMAEDKVSEDLTAVKALEEKGILKGDENGNLNLDKNVTRAEFCKLLIESFENKGNTASVARSFDDVKSSHWAYDYITDSLERGWINGFEDGNFKPEDNVTYEQAVKMTAYAAGVVWGNASYPAEYIQIAMDNYLLDNVKAGIGEAITREDAVNLIYNAMEYIADVKDEEEINKMYSYGYGGIAGSPSMSGGGASSLPAPELGEAPAEDSADVITESNSVSMKYSAINPQQYFNTEEYTREEENIFKNAALSPLSTFSIDTDTASYSNMRRFIIDGSVPTAGSIRSEELINYFDYDLPEPTDGIPFSVTTEIDYCPWNSDNQLAMIAIKGEEITERAPQNLTLLIDMSGSMYSRNKLPLVKKSMKILLNELDERDTVSIVTYANGVSLALDSVNASEKDKILETLDGLYASGGTNGSGGLEMAYEQAEKNLIDGNNRIILCTDGDFNIGPSSTAELEELITNKRDKGIFISVLGFGMGNYKDNRMEIIADKGNGSYYYIDNLREAKKVFVDEITSTLYTIAKDVKIQVEFNPAKVKQYRLVGYENRKLNTEDFADDTKDAGELGAGAEVVALYEIVPARDADASAAKGELRYQTPQYKESDELFCVNLRYKEPDENESKLITQPVAALIDEIAPREVSMNFMLASAAAELGMILNDSEYKGTSTYASVIELAKAARGEDKFGIRTEFIQLADLLKYIDR